VMETIDEAQRLNPRQMETADKTDETKMMMMTFYRGIGENCTAHDDDDDGSNRWKQPMMDATTDGSYW
jgi:hypothetical protein